MSGVRNRSKETAEHPVRLLWPRKARVTRIPETAQSFHFDAAHVKPCCAQSTKTVAGYVAKAKPQSSP